ncbi:N-acetylmuramoyl-L-alanine amidase [Pseudooceanicola onchidii]|uniref:N-acetylmuramoyl-L-alanine amidase n=1 Tax=Pseudooceanicola onchidii TaxID=2562279 RepID=UPI0010A9EBE8|nr:N-acetylmuramoyl-L-alanine amidase [Pseudooceanicola onchidii]
MSRASKLLIAACLVVAGLVSPVQAQGLFGVARIAAGDSALTEDRGRLDLSLSLTQPVPWRIFTLTDPARVVMDFREVDWTGLTPERLRQTALVTDVRFGTYRPGWSRLVLTLADPMALASSAMTVDPDRGTARITARFAPVAAGVFAEGAGAPKTPGWDLPDPAVTAGQAVDDGVLTVVIDPGHGGIDPGAVRGNLTEKTLMLTLARTLAETLIREGDTRVILTREDDSFVPLERRVSLAHEAGADLFISLHADVLPNGRARGATVYTLSEQASDEASAKLAERHDRDDLLSGVDLTGKDDVVAGVLLDLARQETRPRTTAFSRALTEAIGAAEVPLNSHPLRSADFSVLKAADIPSVLIEVGYLSSDRDRENLKDPAFLTRIAGAIRDAILAWSKADAALKPLVRQ